MKLFSNFISEPGEQALGTCYKELQLFWISPIRSSVTKSFKESFFSGNRYNEFMNCAHFVLCLGARKFHGIINDSMPWFNGDILKMPMIRWNETKRTQKSLQWAQWDIGHIVVKTATTQRNKIFSSVVHCAQCAHDAYERCLKHEPFNDVNSVPRSNPTVFNEREHNFRKYSEVNQVRRNIHVELGLRGACSLRSHFVHNRKKFILIYQTLTW